MSRRLELRALEAARALAGLALFGLASLIALACRPTDPDPETNADCQKSRVCAESGRCSLNINTKKCVVGSNADCAQSNVCQKERMCFLVGESCGRGPGE